MNVADIVSLISAITAAIIAIVTALGLGNHVNSKNPHPTANPPTPPAAKVSNGTNG